MKKKQLEGIIDAMQQSLVVIAHNEVETEYVLALIEKHKRHYKEVTGRDYSAKEIRYDRIIEEERA